MTHGIVVINMIPRPALQDGLVMKPVINVLWPIQVMDLDQELLANNTAKLTHMTTTNIDVMKLTGFVKSARKTLPIAIPIEELHVVTVKTQIQTSSSNVTELTQRHQSVMLAQKVKLTVANQELVPVTVVLHHQISSNVIQKHLLAIKLNIQETLNRLVMLLVDISPHKNF